MRQQHKRERILFIVVGILYILVGLLAFYNSFIYGRAEEIFWFCYFSMILIGIGLLTKNVSLVASQIYILLIPDLVWTIDFIAYLLRDAPFLGIVDYFFVPGRPFLMNAVTLQHLFTIPLVLYFFKHARVPRQDVWFISCIQVAIIYVLTKIFTNPITNVNCVYQFCGNLQLNSNYMLWWFGAFFLMIFCAHEILTHIRYLWKPSKSNHSS